MLNLLYFKHLGIYKLFTEQDNNESELDVTFKRERFIEMTEKLIQVHWFSQGFTMQ